VPREKKTSYKLKQYSLQQCFLTLSNKIYFFGSKNPPYLTDATVSNISCSVSDSNFFLTFQIKDISLAVKTHRT